MEKITFMVRAKDPKAQIKVRFRLRDGRDLQLFHSTGISTTVGNLAKFEPSGELAKSVKVYDAGLKKRIEAEYNLICDAYAKMKWEGMDMTSKNLEHIIEEKRNPIEEVRENSVTIVERFHQYMEDAYTDGIVGELRRRHIVVVADKL